MTEDRLPFAELMQKAGDGDLLCQAFGQDTPEKAQAVWRAAADQIRAKWPQALSLRETPSPAF